MITYVYLFDIDLIVYYAMIFGEIFNHLELSFCGYANPISPAGPDRSTDRTHVFKG